MGEAKKLPYYRQSGSFVEPGRNVRIADQPDKTLLAAEETGYHLTGMLGQVSADGAVRITLIEPDHVQATDGGTQFVVTEAELTV